MNEKFLSAIVAVANFSEKSVYVLQKGDDLAALQETMVNYGIEYALDAEQPDVIRMYPTVGCGWIVYA